MKSGEDITHNALCADTANWRLKTYGHVALIDYQSMISVENPDLLIYGPQGTELYEIKVSKQDFKQDSKKEARKKYKPKVGVFRKSSFAKKIEYMLKAEAPELYYLEYPHLGERRYYVCPKGLINVDELPQGWGLYWYQRGRFYEKQKSMKWRNNIRLERDMLTHAFRKRLSEGDTPMIRVNTYTPH